MSRHRLLWQGVPEGRQAQAQEELHPRHAQGDGGEGLVGARDKTFYLMYYNNTLNFIFVSKIGLFQMKVFKF